MHPALCQDAPVNSRMTWNIFRFRDPKAKPSLISSAGDWNLESISQAQRFFSEKIFTLWHSWWTWCFGKATPRENEYGSQTWRFGRWFSFSIGWFWGSIVIFMGVFWLSMSVKLLPAPRIIGLLGGFEPVGSRSASWRGPQKLSHG